MQGDRSCDLSQPGGYCTIADCSPGSCGDEGRCVRFKPDDPRLSRDWCMARCGNSGDCDRDNYVCRSADQLNQGMESRVAETLDGRKSSKFCVVNTDNTDD